jgi:hypothetical protein
MPIPLIDKIEPKNNGNFPMVDAKHVAYKEGRLPDYMPVAITQADYDKLVAEGKVNENTPYLIVEGGNK